MKQREHWGSRLGMIMATAGSAIGLGSLWQFPYVTGVNGGGIFVLLYLLFTFFIGVPIFIAEVVLGRRAQRSPVGAFSEMSSHSKNWKMVGWMCIITNFIILSYYSVVSGWALNYTLMSLTDFSRHISLEQVGQTFDILVSSGGISLFWHFIFMLIAVGTVYGGVRKGIEYWARILTPTLFALLIGLFFYAMTTDGFGDAVKFIFHPDFSKFKPSSSLQALGLSFFTLSVGLGVLITYGSYMKKDVDIPKTAVTVACLDVIVSLMAAMVIFPFVFTYQFAPSEGPGLVFKVLPHLFALSPGTMVLSTLFFLLVVFTALTSAVSVLEVIVANFIELFSWSRRKSVLIVGAAVFIFGIPSALSGSGLLFANWGKIYGFNFLDTLNFLSYTWLLPFNGFCVTLFVGWFLNKKIRNEEFRQGSSWGWLLYPWLLVIRWLAPVAIILIVLQSAGVIDVDAIFAKPVEKALVAGSGE
ncbi:sodium-dependent transporter [Simkania negevensis]|uniref:Sodium-dependent transporter n=1 Tax=Simkania negevensis TaxID=83561 RepID=A0ABS3AVE4_9BACT|nr:sodium-dependent transporter [Simkania negevensis]